MSSNVNLLVVSDLASNSGGSYRVAIESCLALAGCGIRPQLIHAGDEIDESLQTERNVLLHRLDLSDVTAMGGLRGALSYVWSADSYRKCLRLFRQVSQTGPTVLHVHSYGRRFSPAVFSAAKRVGIPIVLSLHDYFAFSPTGLHYDFGNDCTLASDANVWTPWRTTDRMTSHHWFARRASGVLSAQRNCAECHRLVHCSIRAKSKVRGQLPAGKISTNHLFASKRYGRALSPG